MKILLITDEYNINKAEEVAKELDNAILSTTEVLVTNEWIIFLNQYDEFSKNLKKKNIQFFVAKTWLDARDILRGFVKPKKC